MSEEAYRAVEDWLDAYHEHGDPASVCGPAALADARRLERGASRDAAGLIDPHTAFLLGMFHLYRCSAGGSFDDHVVAEAAAFFANTFRRDPSVVPDELRPALEELVEQHRPSHPAIAGARLLTQVNEGGRVELIDDAVALLDEAVRTARPDSAALGANAVNLGNALILRFHLTGRDSDVDWAAEVLRAAWRADPTDDEVRTGVYRLLLAVTEARPDDGDLAIDVYRDLAASMADDDPHYIDVLNRRAEALRLRALRRPGVEDLDEAIAAAGAAFSAAPPEHRDRPVLCSQLATLYRFRYERTRADADIEAARGYAREALSALAADAPGFARRLSSLGNVLRYHAEHSGDPADLNDAVQAHRTAVGAASPEDPELGGILSNLAAALLVRYKQLGAETDLHEAIERLRESVRRTPNAHHARHTHLGHLAGALLYRYDLLNQVPDLNEGLAAFRAVAGSLPGGHPDRPRALLNLAAALATSYAADGTPAILDEAVTAAREAAHDCPPGGQYGVGFSAHLSRLLLNRHAAADAPADLAEAAQASGRALDACGPDHPELADALEAASLVSFAQYVESADGRLLSTAIDQVMRAAAISSARVDRRIRDAQLAATMAVARELTDPAALAGYSVAVGLLPLLAWPGVDRPTQERRLRDDAQGLASDAAAVSVAAGQAEFAAALLEQGRGVLWGQLLEARTDLSRVRAVDRHLAERLAQVRRELDGNDVPNSITRSGHSAVPRTRPRRPA